MKTRLLAAAAILMLPLAAVAADDDRTSPSPAGASFDTLDANKDGRISMPEASADPSLVESFSTADRNGDGYLDSSEFESSTDKRGADPR